MTGASPVEFVLLPIGHIVLDVVRDETQFVHVSDNAFVVSGLPFERQIVLTGKFGDTDFEPPNHRCQIFGLRLESIVRCAVCLCLFRFPGL